jgi:hypothetical protein
MARQPFLPTNKGKGYAIGANQIDALPDFVTAIGRCLTMWPYIEHQMAMILGHLMDARNEATIAVFSAIRTGRTQRDALAVAASVALADNPKVLKLLTAVLSVINSASESRTTIAHGLWGVLAHRKDRILWVESKHYGPWNTLAIVRDDVGHEQLQKNLYVWSLGDILEIEDQLKECWEIVFDFYCLLANRGAGQCGLAGDQLYDHLCQLPRVAAALDRQDKKQNSQKG